MPQPDTKRLSRLIALLTQLQTKRLLTAAWLAEKFEVSKRTIYRDLKALEQAGVPVQTDEGRGYSLMEGYKIPPIMFSESEANALITARQLVIQNKDASFVKEYTQAIDKITAVLRGHTQTKANLLAERVLSGQNAQQDRSSNNLSTLQLALTHFKLVDISYRSLQGDAVTQRIVEPFAIYTFQENWLLVAFCRVRKDYRAFRLDRIMSLSVLEETFTPHQLSFEDYFELCRKKCSPPLP